MARVDLLTQVKNSVQGTELIKWLDEQIEETRREFELNGSPNDVGESGVFLGRIRTLHFIKEVLLADYQGEPVQEE